MSTRDKIEVMQAFVDGKVIEYKLWTTSEDPKNWRECLNPLWDWDVHSYRIKPEPKVIWANEYVGGWGYFYSSREGAKEMASEAATRIAVKYQEVVEN